jgi:hypothetical protein
MISPEGLERDTRLFGPIPGAAAMSACSQWIQAEGLRFIPVNGIRFAKVGENKLT